MKILTKKYYHIHFRLKSPMNIGSDNSTYTDKDVLKDSRNLPFIPGSTLAGIYRSLFEDNDKLTQWFGDVTIAQEKNNQSTSIDSRIQVFDACVCPETSVISRRDCVSLDEWKTAIDGTKFDFEVVEPETMFDTYYLINVSEEDDPGYGDAIAYAWQHDLIQIGSKTERGLGSVKDVQIKEAEFTFDTEENINNWLDFDMYDNSNKNWQITHSKDSSLLKKKPVLKISLSLKLRGGISVRRYTTDNHSNYKEESAPDFVQLKLRTKKQNTDEIQYAQPVIPGTSWAGVFRHVVHQLDSEEEKDFFGVVIKNKDNNKKEAKRSYIRFSETLLDGGTDVQLTRSSIDRITGGSQKGELFTESTYYGGKGNLDITFMKKPSKDMLNAIAICIADLNAGFMSVGGETSIGRGLFEVNKLKINDEAILDSENIGPMEFSRQLYHKIMEVEYD